VQKILKYEIWNHQPGFRVSPVLPSVASHSRNGKWFQASGKTDWETPQAFFEQVNVHFHFEIDVCASKQNAKCSKYFTAEKDGLQQKWEGTCWCNPPYGRGIEEWLYKAWQSSKSGATVVCLVPGNTSTRWWHDCVVGKAACVYFVQGKVQFVGAAQGAPFSSALVVFAQDHKDLGVRFIA